VTQTFIFLNIMVRVTFNSSVLKLAMPPAANALTLILGEELKVTQTFIFLNIMVRVTNAIHLSRFFWRRSAMRSTARGRVITG
jgi:hypothetical protein